MFTLQTHPVKIFLSGPSGIGKTTILKRIIADFPPEFIEGCIAQEVLNDDRRTGFEIKYLRSNKISLMASLSSSKDRFSVGDFSVNVDLLERELVPYLNSIIDNQNVQILCLDEIGRMQILAKNFLNTVDKILYSNKPLLATILHDDEIWARKYKNKQKYYYINVTEENREQLPILISTILKQEKLLLAQDQETREKILYLFNSYITENRIPELLKLFQHTISYITNKTIEDLDKPNLYLVHGFHGNYVVKKHDNDKYSCTCKFFSETSENRECSHIQTVWILKEKNCSIRPCV